MAFLLKSSFGKHMFKINCQLGQQILLQSLKTTSVNLIPNKQNRDTTQHNDISNEQKKRKETVKITLMQGENSITVTGLEDAKNLAKRRSLHLVKVHDIDAKSQRPVYKLLTSADMLQKELSEMKKSDKSATAAASKKSEKSLSIGSRIAEHDIASRLKTISKWLNKQHEVRILMQATSEQDLGNCEKIVKRIEEVIKTPQVIGRIVQKRTNGNIIKFSILPVIPTKNETTDTNSQ